MTTPKLKPCPFCGGKAKLSVSSKKLLALIRCANRRCRIVPTAIDWDSNSEELIAAWNRRAGDKGGKK